MKDRNAFIKFTIINGHMNKDPARHDNDIWYLQNDPANAGALFQVASNFNGLEQPSWDSQPGFVKNYFHDPTQGPYASLCTYPATMWRRHAWAVQSGGSPPNDPINYKGYPGILVKPDMPRIYSGLSVTLGGWLDATNVVLHFAPVTDVPGWMAAVIALSTGIGALGIRGCDSIMRHEHAVSNTVTILGKPVMINQMLTSAVDNLSPRPGSFANDRILNMWSSACLLAAYCNTLFYAWKNRIPKVFLTLVGGGVFGNPYKKIMTYMLVAMGAVAKYSISQNDDFHTKMEIKLVLWNGGEIVPTPDGKKTTLYDIVRNVVMNSYPQNHAQFLSTAP